MKKILYCDMDGVIANFNKGVLDFAPHAELDNEHKEYEVVSDNIDKICQAYPDIFQHLEPMDGALEAIPQLMSVYDVYFLSTPMWALPSSYTGKRIWLEKHFGKAIEKRLILSHRKDLLLGDILIDDRLRHGVDKFVGEHIHFGTGKFPDWEAVLDYLLVTKTW